MKLRCRRFRRKLLPLQAFLPQELLQVLLLPVPARRLRLSDLRSPVNKYANLDTGDLMLPINFAINSSLDGNFAIARIPS